MVKRNGLNPRQQIFAHEYLIDLNATAAYKRAGYRGKGHAAESAAARMLRNVEVKKATDQAIAARAERTEITADDVLRRWIQIVEADPRELVEIRRGCCRFCHGDQFRYQRTRQEMNQARAGWEIHTAKDGTKPSASPVAPFDALGGDGFDGSKRPHPDCPECFGEGVVSVFFKDTRNLSENARRLYAGVKVSKDGITKVIMKDQMAALTNIARHLGMFTNHAKRAAEEVVDVIPIRLIEVFRPAPGESDEAVTFRENRDSA